MPYAPQANDNRGGLMLAGLLESGRQAGAGAAAATQWLNQFLQQQKQINAAGKSADFFVKSDPTALSQMGVHEDEWDNMGAKDKAMAVQGLMQSRAGQQAAAENAARTALQRAQAERLGQTTQLTEEESQSLPLLMQNLDQMNQQRTPGAPIPATTIPAPLGMRLGPSAGTVPPGLGGAPDQDVPMPAGALDGITLPATTSQGGGAPPMSPGMAALVHAAAGMGATNPRLAASIARQVLPKLLETGTENGVQFTEDPVSGLRFATFGKSMQQSGTNPSKAGPTMIPQHDPDTGDLIGYSEVDARGHSKFTAAKGNAKLKPAVDASTGNTIQGFYVDPNTGKILDARSAMLKITGGQQGTNAPAAIKPGSKGKLNVDQAREFLNQAGGDKATAQKLATEAGYTY